jgi:hypothetical protein
MFAYCENNPVLFKDSFGNILEIASRQKNPFLNFLEKALILSMLSMLTDDILSFDGTSVSIKTQSDSGRNVTGTNLIREIINSEKTATISYDSSFGRTITCPSPVGLSSDTDNPRASFADNTSMNAIIYLMPSDFNSAKTNYVPGYIIIGHELIHAYEFLMGIATPAEVEARVVGIGPYRNNNYTEDHIRAEHGLEPRYPKKYTEGELEK